MQQIVNEVESYPKDYRSNQP